MPSTGRTFDQFPLPEITSKTPQRFVHFNFCTAHFTSLRVLVKLALALIFASLCKVCFFQIIRQ